MNGPLFIPYPGNEAMAEKLAGFVKGEAGTLALHTFPDGETELRLGAGIGGRDLALVCTLAHPNSKFLPLVFAARTARELGAKSVGLVAPYLCYMRQDKRFQPGEAISARHFASLVSRDFDWLVTLDPHLHRYKNLDEIYSIPTRTVHAAPLLGRWIKEHVQRPFLVGPDEESAQWVKEVASACGSPYAVLRKERLGDQDVKIAPATLSGVGGATPVLIDDIVSTGTTLQAALRAIAGEHSQPPVIVAVHGIFAGGADTMLEKEGARLVTTNSIPHPSNRIDVSGLLGEAIAAQLGEPVRP